MHIMTGRRRFFDKSGREKKYGFTLLNSYLTIGEKCLPETYFHPEELYSAMNKGVKDPHPRLPFMKDINLRKRSERFEKFWHICAWARIYRQYQGAIQWKKEHDKQDKLL